METFVLIALFCVGAMAGAGFVLFENKRFKKMRAAIREYSEVYGIVEKNKLLIAERDSLKHKYELQRSEIKRYRKSLTANAYLISNLKTEIKGLKETAQTLQNKIENVERNENERFGRFMRIITKEGIKLSQQDLNSLTP